MVDDRVDDAMAEIPAGAVDCLCGLVSAMASGLIDRTVRKTYLNGVECIYIWFGRC